MAGLAAQPCSNDCAHDRFRTGQGTYGSVCAPCARVGSMDIPGLQVYSNPREIAIEEENIRKHTTPAYRAPEVRVAWSTC